MTSPCATCESRFVSIDTKLDSSPLFAAMPPIVRDAIAARAFKRKVRRGGTVLGHEPVIIILVTGRVDVIDDGTVIRSLVPPATVGLSIVAGAEATAEIRAAEDSSVIVVPGDAVLAAIKRHPEAALAAVAHLGSMIGDLSSEIAALRKHGLIERIRHRLEQLGRGRREIAITHAQLAEEVGGERANVTRALARLEKQGVIVRRRGRIELT